MRRQRALAALLTILVTTATTGRVFALGRSPVAFECQAAIAAVLAKLASKEAKCISNSDDECLQDVLADGQDRLQSILEKSIENQSLDRCMPGVCGAADTVPECTASVLTDLGDPVTGRKEGDFKCMGRSARLLSRFARNVGKCRRDATKAQAKGRPFDLDICVELLIARNLSDFRSVLVKLVSNGSTVDKCVLQNLCAAQDDVFQCAEQVLTRSATQALEGGAGESKGTTERAAQCREDVADILLDVTEAAAGCRAENAKKTAKGEPFDLAGCIQRPVDRFGARVANLLAKVFDKGVTPDLCLPNVCEATNSPFVCARDAVDGAAGL